MLMAITTVLAALVALQWGYNPLAVAAVSQRDGGAEARLPRSRSARHRPGADHLLFAKGHGHPERQGARDGRVEGAALCRDAPQRQSAGRLFRCPDRTGRRDGPRSRDLSDAVATLHSERLAKP